MSTTVEIPGGTATLRDELKQRHRQMLQAAGMAAEEVLSKFPKKPDGTPDLEQVESVRFTFEESNSLLDLQNAAILAYLESWTRPEPLPTWDTIGDMDTDVFDALSEATKERAADEIAGPVDFSESPDRETPTGPSSASDGLLRDGQAPADPTVTPPLVGESTVTAPYTAG